MIGTFAPAKKIVLLGANGQLGSDLQQELSGYNLIPVLRAELDVEQEDSIDSFLSTLAPIDYLINCTAFHQMEACELQPLKAMAINSTAVLRMAQWCQRNQVIFIHFSSDYVFDGKRLIPYREEDTPGPLNVYGHSKLMGERMVQACMERFFIFRVSSLFGTAGASGKGGNFVETMLRMAREGRALRVVADQVMSPTYTLEIARTIHMFIKHDVQAFGIYHCAGKGACSWHAFAAEIFRLCGLQPDLQAVNTADNGSAVTRPAYSVLDQAKLSMIRRMPHWQDSLSDYLRLKQHL